MVVCLSYRGHAPELTTKCFVKETTAYTLCGIFDGQGGVEAAAFANHFLQSYLTHNLKKVDLEDFSSHCRNKIQKLLEHAFESCQQQMLISKERSAFIHTGCTACIALRIGKMMYIANCGDTSAFIVDKGRALKCVSVPHTLQNQLEKVGIIESGGWYSNGLICDKSRVTRALGNLWQVRTLKWHKANNLYHYDRDMQDWNLSRLRSLLRDAPPAWSINPKPSVNTIELGPDDFFLCIKTAGMVKLLENETDFLWEQTVEKALSKLIQSRGQSKGVNNASIISLDITDDGISSKENLEDS